MLKSKAVKTIEENKRRTFLATEITKPLNLSTISISKAIKRPLGALQGFERLQAASSRHVQPLARCNLRAVRDND